MKNDDSTWKGPNHKWFVLELFDGNYNRADSMNNDSLDKDQIWTNTFDEEPLSGCGCVILLITLAACAIIVMELSK